MGAVCRAGGSLVKQIHTSYLDDPEEECDAANVHHPNMGTYYERLIFLPSSQFPLPLSKPPRHTPIDQLH